MAAENGVATTNGTGPTRNGSDDFDDVSSVAVRVDVIDETGNDVSMHASQEVGLDNPAFISGGEEEEEAGIISATNGGTRNHPSADVVSSATNGHQQHHQHQSNGGKGDMEMAPLNPNPAPPTAPPHNNKKAAKNGSANTVAAAANATNGGKDQSKTALDNICNNDYFRPVNTKRKLLRGEKLYVMSDQRAQSRGWKWIAFWGGVFTFVAAALLAGILAATGVIMSKSEPSLSASNSLIAGNLSDASANDTLLEENDVTPHSGHTNHVIPSETHNWNNNTDTFPMPTMTHDEQHHHHSGEPTTSTPVSHSDNFGNALDNNMPSTMHQLPDQHSTVHHQPDNHQDHLYIATADHNATLDEPTVESAAPPSGVSVVPTGGSAVPERARSLDKEASFVPAENATLFPTMHNFDSSDDDFIGGEPAGNVTSPVDATNHSTAVPSLESEIDPIGWSTSAPGGQSDGDSSDNSGIFATNATELDEPRNETVQPTNDMLFVNDTLTNQTPENETDHVVTATPTNPASSTTHSTISTTNESTVVIAPTNDTAETMTSLHNGTNSPAPAATPLDFTRTGNNSGESNMTSPEMTNVTSQAVINVTANPHDLTDTVENDENLTTTIIHQRPIDHNSTGNRTGKSDDGEIVSNDDVTNNTTHVTSATVASITSSSPLLSMLTSGLPVHNENGTSDDVTAASDMTKIVDFAITTIVTTIHEEDVPVPFNATFPVPLNTSLPVSSSTSLPLNETRA